MEQEFTREQRKEMPYGILFEAVEALQEAKLQSEELERKNLELSELVTKGISS